MTVEPDSLTIAEPIKTSYHQILIKMKCPRRSLVGRRRTFCGRLLAIGLISLALLYLFGFFDGWVMPNAGKGVHTRQILENSMRPGLDAPETHSLVTEDKDKFHYHPKSMDELWTKVTPKTIARRMAYFDTRDPNYPAVAFITMHDDREKIKPLIYARLVYEDGSSVCTRLEYWGHSGELDLRSYVRELYVHYLMRNTKMIDSSSSPISATLTTDSTCSGGHSKTILIKDTRKQKSNYDFGVCLHQALYNLTDPQLLVDWVELNIALGAKVITVYLQDVSESYYELMLPYIGRGVVEVLDWKMGIPYIKEYTKIWGQTGVISECIFRNINRVKYLGLMDADEFFVPQKHLTIPEMLLDLEKMAGARNSASFILYNAFMWNDGIPLPEVACSTKCPGMKWPRYFMNTKRSFYPPYQYKYHKLIVKPLAVNTAWCHYIFEPWQKGYTKEFYVPVKLGLTHHYRFPEKKTKSWKSQTFTMSRYFEVTRKGIMEQMCHANY